MEVTPDLSIAGLGLAFGCLAGFAVWMVLTEVALAHPWREALGGYVTQFWFGLTVCVGGFGWALLRVADWSEQNSDWVILVLLGGPLLLLCASIALWFKFRRRAAGQYNTQPRKAWHLAGTPMISGVHLLVSSLMLATAKP